MTTVGSGARIARSPATVSLALAATGVVFGDIGTSPIYAFRESIAHTGGDPSEAAIGTASLAIWAVTLVVTVKYLSVVMRADNNGEGGILALLALLRSWINADGSARFGSTRRRTFVMLALLAGAALLFGDGALTPAISVLSAVEGLDAAAPALGDLAVPIAVAILVALFAVQSRGTASIGRVFGPVMSVWFVVIAGLGLYRIVQAPDVLRALSPTYAISYLVDEGWEAIALLGVIILTVTGAEALYADMGHFGIRPIRLTWYALVMPSLLLCYLGQAALVLDDPSQASDPFYGLAPNAAAALGLVLLATAATVIASQALITGAFSLAQQAIQLRILPRLRIRHTSDRHEGQIYVPAVNWTVGATCIILTISFGSSSALASAYGIAVSGTMLATTIGLFAVARYRWRWPAAKRRSVIGLFFVVDIAFFVATATKFVNGGYVPVAIGAAIMTAMIIWLTGQHLLHQTVRAGEPTWDQTLDTIARRGTTQVPGTGVFLNSDPHRVPQALLTLLALTRSAPRTILAVTVVTRSTPYLGEGDQRVEAEELQTGVWRVLVRTGYMETIALPHALSSNADAGYPFPDDLAEVVYYMGRTNFQDTPDGDGRMGRIPEALYDVMQRNSASPTDYFNLPPRRAVTIGTHIDL